MTRILAALLLSASFGPFASAQQARVVVPQAPIAPALGQLGAALQGAFMPGLAGRSPAVPALDGAIGAAGPTAPGVSAALPGGALSAAPIVQLSPSALALPAGLAGRSQRFELPALAGAIGIAGPIASPGQVSVAAGRVLAAPGAALESLPKGANAKKLLILLERATKSGAASAKSEAAAAPADARSLLTRVSSELETMSVERLRSMPLDELNAWSARLLEGAASRCALDAQVPGVGSRSRESLARRLRSSREAAEPAAAPEPVPAPAPEAPVPAEAKRTILGFTLARIFSISVFALHQIAFAFMAIDAVGRDSFVLVMMISGFASIPLAFVNGMLVDKLTPRQILIGGSALLATASVVMGLLQAAGMITFAALIPLSIVTQFMLIAVIVGESSLIPKILKDAPHAIPRTFALFDLVFAGISALASVLGGLLVKNYLGFAGTFYVYAAVQALVVIPIYLWFMPKVEAAAQKAPGFGEALRRLRQSPYLLALLGLSFAAVLLVFPLRITLLPVIVKDFLHGTPADQGFINTAVFLGMLLASVFNVTLAKKVKNSKLLLASAAAFAGFGVLLALPMSIPAMFAGIAIIFLLQAISENVLRGLYSMEAGKVHPEFVGRLMGVRSAMFGAAIAGGTWLVKASIGGAAYPALLWWMAPAYAAVLFLYIAAPWILRWAHGRTHPGGGAAPKELG